MAKTLAQLRAAVRQLADVVNNTGKFPDVDVNDRINEAVAELYDLVTSKTQHHYLTVFPFTLAGGYAGNSVATPADFYKAVRLEWSPGTTQVMTVHAVGQLEQNAARLRQYAIGGSSLSVFPPLYSQGAYALYYTPDPPQLASDGATLDQTLAKWPLYVQLSAAIAIVASREMDTSALEKRLFGVDGNGGEKARVVQGATSRTEEAEQVPRDDSRWRSPWDFPPNT